MQSESVQPTKGMGWRTMAVVYAVSWVAGVQLIFWFGNLFKLRPMIESFVYPAMIVAVLAMPGVRGLWTKAGLAARCAAGALILLMVNAQLLRKSDATFPVCAWTMYGAKKPVRLQFVDLAGVREDGVRVRLDMDDAVPYSRPFVGLISNVMERSEKLRITDPPKAEADLAALDRVLADIARYNSRINGGAPFVRVEVVGVTLDGTGKRVREEVGRSVELNPAPAGGAR